MKPITKKDPEYCRSIAAEYLGVASATLKKYPIPYRQYSRFGYALYKKSDLDKFKESKTFTPPVVVVNVTESIN